MKQWNRFLVNEPWYFDDQKTSAYRNDENITEQCATKGQNSSLVRNLLAPALHIFRALVGDKGSECQLQHCSDDDNALIVFTEFGPMMPRKKRKSSPASDAKIIDAQMPAFLFSEFGPLSLPRESITEREEKEKHQYSSSASSFIPISSYLTDYMAQMNKLIELRSDICKMKRLGLLFLALVDCMNIKKHLDDAKVSSHTDSEFYNIKAYFVKGCRRRE